MFNNLTISSYKVVFWDFDGVIKDSLHVKAEAFANLFPDVDDSIRQKIKSHHFNNGGLSRTEKIPLYASWAGINATPAIIEKYISDFGELVVNGVINSPWIPGVYEYIKSNHTAQDYFLISATPQKELQKIIESINLSNSFKRVFGSPSVKSNVIKMVVCELGLKLSDCLMIGDSKVDLCAAQENGINFLYRSEDKSSNSIEDYRGPRIANFLPI